MCSKCINIRVSNHHLKYIDCYPIHIHELGFMELDLKFNIKRAYSKPLKKKCHYKGYSSPLYSFVPYFSTIAYFHFFFTAFARFTTLPTRFCCFYFVRICHARAIINQLPNLEHFIIAHSSVMMVLSIILPSIEHEPAIPHIHSAI
jgi:hypothetical protein